MSTDQFNNIDEIVEAFPTEEICLKHLQQLRWEDIVISPFDPISKVYSCKNNNFRCRNSGKYFNAKTGTMFYNSKIPLQKWFIAIWLVTRAQPDISSVDLGIALQLTQKSAWYMLKRIKNNYEIAPANKGHAEDIKKIFNQEVLDINLTVEDDKFKMSQWLNLLKRDK